MRSFGRSKAAHYFHLTLIYIIYAFGRVRKGNDIGYGCQSSVWNASSGATPQLRSKSPFLRILSEGFAVEQPYQRK